MWFVPPVLACIIRLLRQLLLIPLLSIIKKEKLRYLNPFHFKIFFLIRYNCAAHLNRAFFSLSRVQIQGKASTVTPSKIFSLLVTWLSSAREINSPGLSGKSRLPALPRLPCTFCSLVFCKGFTTRSLLSTSRRFIPAQLPVWLFWVHWRIFTKVEIAGSPTLDTHLTCARVERR